MPTPAEKFVHLHVHSHFSLLDGANTIDALVGACQNYKMPALALTDHGNMFGAVQFYQKCTAGGIKPIIGLEAYVSPTSRFDRERISGTAYYHYLLLARNEEGYRNLMALSTKSFTEGFYYKPRIDKELMALHNKGLVASSACMSSEINRKAVSGTDEELEDAIKEHRDLFEPGCFFLEIQRHGIPEQERIIERVPPIAKKLGIPLIATNDIHYLTQDHAKAQEIHLCINTGTTISDEDRMQFDKDGFYFRSGAEMERVLGDYPEALENTRNIADMVDFKMEFGKFHLPKFEKEGVKDLKAYLRHLCEEGARARYKNYDHNPEIRKRLDYELGVIESMGFVSYFLITWDFIHYSREHSIAVGPGRGSAAGSIVAYVLGITDIDPLHYDLIFERFLNPKRISMPDIDIDFCMDRRTEVIDYVKEKYGEDRVCQIITFGTMAARAVIRDVGRVLEIPLADINAIAKKIPSGPGVKLDKSLKESPELQKIANSNQQMRDLFDTAMKLEGLNRHSSTHAAGVVISDEPLLDTIPLCGKDGVDISTQYPMEDLESCGMLKLDFLGLRTLTIIERTLEQIRHTQGIEVDVRNLPLDDKPTYDLLEKGETVAVFQLESDGMRDLLRRMQPDSFADIIAILALYRPGPLESGMVDMYVERKHGREPIAYEHDCLEDILKETNGVILYQEQVMRIANVMCNFDLGDADSLRKAMGKKKPEIMAKFAKQFLDGAEANGVDRKNAQIIWDNIVKFAGYGFNKSHSTAYAYISYQTAYLKANFPAEFMAGVMTCEMNNVDKIVENIEECHRLGIEVLPPHINYSREGFHVEEGKIWYGLGAIKGLGTKVVQTVVEERVGNAEGKGSYRDPGPYKSVFDLAERVEASVLNRSAIQCLAKCGALDSFGQTRNQLFTVAEEAVARSKSFQKDANSDQLTMFDMLFEQDNSQEDNAQLNEERYPDVEDWSELERLHAERETLGHYISGHPLDTYKSLIQCLCTHTVKSVETGRDKDKSVVGALITKLTAKKSNRTGKAFFIAVAEDQTGSMELFIDQKLYDAHNELLEEGSMVFLMGSIRYRDTNASLSVRNIIALDQGIQQLTEDLSILIRVDREEESQEDRMYKLKAILEAHKGATPVFLVLRNDNGERVSIQVGRENYIQPTPELFNEVEELLGKDRFGVNQSKNRWAHLV